MDSVKEGIRLNLIELLEKTGKKRSDLAKACGVGKSAVSNWASGDSSIDVERIPSICEFFGITIDEFFGRSRELEPTPDLTSDEWELVSNYRKCHEGTKSTIRSLASSLSLLPDEAEYYYRQAIDEQIEGERNELMGGGQ